jgi:hypothetical protein
MLRILHAVAVMLVIAQEAPPRKLYPADLARQDASLAAFRDRVLDAAARRDIDALRPLLADQVLSEEGPVAPADFAAALKRGQRETQERFWRELWDAFHLGFARDERGQIWAPYVNVRLSGWETPLLAITGTNVNLRERPALDASVVATLTYDVVNSAPGHEAPTLVTIDGFSYQWIKIVTASGREGWVLNKYAASPHGLWFGVELVNGSWKLAYALPRD